ncbi:lysozyme inhibitor LprI family protein [Trinickia mobilis]|uniref:lysozyme inhibitor LprI family protein n=1 Tax=Trinickia mobilis TaxID=2816356 RepID=UPI001F5CDCF5|nr:lysozyme inhibitor LprI family protein [Trinickia mobilis]
MSHVGLTALRIRERAVLHYYNDIADNCTHGVGTLAHHGPCTEDELRRPVTPAMKRAFVMIAAVSRLALAAPNPVDELAARSGLPASEVGALLSNCDADQTSMNFCAWRDQIVAEQELQRIVDQKSAASPDCGVTLKKKITAWKKNRDSSCKKSADREWHGGSMLPAAIAICATAETKRMTKAIRAKKCN